MKLNYQKSFLKSAKAVYKVTNGLTNLSFPLDILKIISSDKKVKLMTFAEFSQISRTLYFQIPIIFGSEEAFHVRNGNKAMIIYNESLPMNRLRFTLAHEYGHFVMKHTGVNLNKSFNKNDFYRRKAEEFEANCFASCLLFPLHIRYRYYDYLDMYKVSEMFQITSQASAIAINVTKQHLFYGLEDYMSINEKYHAENYLLFLEESLEREMEFNKGFNYIYDLSI